MERMTELQIQEHQARCLRTEYTGDPLVRLLVEFDLVIRRAASRVRSLIAGDPARQSESP